MTAKKKRCGNCKWFQKDCQGDYFGNCTKRLVLPISCQFRKLIISLDDGDDCPCHTPRKRGKK